MVMVGYGCLQAVICRCKVTNNAGKWIADVSPALSVPKELHMRHAVPTETTEPFGKYRNAENKNPVSFSDTGFGSSPTFHYTL